MRSTPTSLLYKSLKNFYWFPTLKKNNSSGVCKLLLVLFMSYSSSYLLVSALRATVPDLRNAGLLASKTTRLQATRIRRNRLHCLFATSSSREIKLGESDDSDNAIDLTELHQFVFSSRCSCSLRSLVGMREARITTPLTTLLTCCFSSLSSKVAIALDDNMELETSTFATTLERYFPSALTSKQTADRVVNVLRGR